MRRLAAPHNSLVLCLQNEPPGGFMIDSRGQWYCMPNNGYGKGKGLRRMNAADVEYVKARGIEPRPSMTLYDLLERVVNER